MRTLAILATALSLAVAPAAGARPPGKVPSAFVGVIADGPLLEDPSVDLGSQLDTMVTSGVQTIRTNFNWAQAQPYRSFSDVPQDQLSRYRDEAGVPTDYSETDRLVAAAAARRLVVLPIPMLAPSWDSRHPGELSSAPVGAGSYANYVGALARRYGPAGSFWSEHPELIAQPIRNWQIWNEPNVVSFWSDRPFADDYVELLREARSAILGADPGATIVLAGMPNKSWVPLRKLYRAGAHGLFDVAAFHPFTATVRGVRTILERDRRVMAEYQDSRKPIWVTELSWTSAKNKTTRSFGNEETESGQAKKLAGAFSMLAAQRRRLRVQRVYWYTWLSRDALHDYPFDWAGLSKVTADGVKAKPALAALRRTALRLEHCHSKRRRADRCAT